MRVWTTIATATTSRATATAGAPTALSTTTTALAKGRDSTTLGINSILLGALETNLELHHRVKVLKLLVVNQDSSFYWVEG